MSRRFKLERWESKASSYLKKKKKITNKVKAYDVAREEKDVQEKSRNRVYLKLWLKNSSFDLGKSISNSPTCCSYQNRSSCSVGCFLKFFPAPVFLGAAPFFSHNFNKTTVIIPPITAPKKAPFKNSSVGNIFLVCPDQAQITPHTV